MFLTRICFHVGVSSKSSIKCNLHSLRFKGLQGMSYYPRTRSGTKKLAKLPKDELLTWCDALLDVGQDGLTLGGCCPHHRRRRLPPHLGVAIAAAAAVVVEVLQAELALLLLLGAAAAVVSAAVAAASAVGRW